MMEEITNLIDRDVYTNQGIKLGVVGNVILDISNDRVDGLFVTNTNPQLIENSVNVSVPYRWVQAIGDIIILKYFPPKLVVKREQKEEEE